MKTSRAIRSPAVRVAASSVLAILGLLLFGIQPASAVAPYGNGDVFAGIGDGKIKHYSPTGSLLDVLDTGTGPTDPPANETGMCFDSSGNLYATDYDAFQMTKFDGKGAVLQNPWGPTFQASPETCVGNKAGDAIYIGTGAMNSTLYKRDLTGNQVATYTLALDQFSVDWIDLAADGCTIYYTSEGALVKRFNVCTNTQLSDFASGLPGPCFQVAIRANGDVLVACDAQIERLNSSGTVVQTYNPGTESDWFTVALDPDGTSFWVAAYTNGHIYKANISSGSVLTTFTATPSAGAGLAGLAVSNPAYPRPVGASPITVALVPAFSACSAGSVNSTHGNPLNFGSCNPATPASSTARLGSKSTGFAELEVCAVNSSVTQCSAPGVVKPDIRLFANLRDVRCALTGTPSGCSADGDYNPNGAAGPYTSVCSSAASCSNTLAQPYCAQSGTSSSDCIAGTDLTLTGRVPGAASGKGVRITDTYNGSAQNVPATTADGSFPVPMDCLPSPSNATIGSTCAVNTSANALAPGAIRTGDKAIWQLGEIQVLDAGPNGTRGDSDDQPLAAQGVYVP
jgi:hypothetical protein